MNQWLITSTPLLKEGKDGIVKISRQPHEYWLLARSPSNTKAKLRQRMYYLTAWSAFEAERGFGELGLNMQFW
jgi:hypothetical protein